MRRALKMLIWTAISIAALVFIAITAFSVILWRADRNRPIQAEVEREAHRQLQPGSSRIQVEAYLDAHHFHHTFNEDTSQEIAFVGPVRGSGIVLNELTLQFQFDASGRLQTLTSRITLTGP